jgi:hypothetical protein
MLNLFDKVAALFYQKQGTDYDVSEPTATTALQLVHILNLMSHGAMPVDMKVGDGNVIFTTCRGRLTVTETDIHVECFDGLNIYPKENTDLSKPAAPDPPVMITIQAAGSKGGKARAATLSPEARKLIASKAAKARWSKARRNVDQQPSRLHRDVDSPVPIEVVNINAEGSVESNKLSRPEEVAPTPVTQQATVNCEPEPKDKAKRNRKRSLSDEQAVEIHRRYANKEATMEVLAKEYNVRPTTVFQVIHGDTYKHLGLPPMDISRKFTDADVRNIRHAVKIGHSYSAVAEMMGVSVQAISQIVKKKLQICKMIVE